MSLEFITKQTPVGRGSDEFGRVEHLLQLSLASATARVDNVYAVGNPQLSAQFERIVGDRLVIDAWADAECFTNPGEICQRGFKFGSDGMIFSSGNISLPKRTVGSGHTYEFILCRVGVGRSFVLNESFAMTQRPTLPAGYDSIYLYRPETSGDGDDANDDDGATRKAFKAFCHEYLLFDPKLAVPAYLVQFTYDADADARALNKGIHHVSTSDTASGALWDPVHGRVVPAGVRTNSTLVPIDEAYRATCAQLNAPDVVVESIRTTVQRHMAAVDTQLQAVAANRDELEKLIYAIVERTVESLALETNKKTSVLLGDEIELRRQLQQLRWMELFLVHQQRVLSPAAFMVAWARHCRMRAELHAALAEHERSDVPADMRLSGNLAIVTEATADVDAGQSLGGRRAPWDNSTASSTATTSLRASLLNTPAKPKTPLRSAIATPAPVQSSNVDAPSLDGDDDADRARASDTPDDIWRRSLRSHFERVRLDSIDGGLAATAATDT